MKRLICIATLLSCFAVSTYSYTETITKTNSLQAITTNPDLEAVKAYYVLISNQDTDPTVLAQNAASVIDVNWKRSPGLLTEQGLTGFANIFATYHQAIPNMTCTSKNIFRSGRNYTVRSLPYTF